MIYISIAAFALAAVLGLAILMKWLSKQEASRSVIYSHRLAAVTGLLLLIIYSVQHPENFPKVSVVLFIVAAVAGIYMFILDMNKKPHPIAVAFTHAIVAVVAFVSLLLFVFS
jgi:hypothetical protein